MNIYIIMTEAYEYVAAYADKAKAEAFVARSAELGETLIIRYDWLIGTVE